ncbi:MAG: GPP34 family phosphoprotein [Verrucomicrobiota bacterium]
MNDRLHLYEEFMLLALHDDKGTVQIQYIEYAVAGCFLAELLLEGRVSMDGSRRKIISLVSEEETGDPLLDDCLRMLSEFRKDRPLSHWIGKLCRQSDLRHRIARQLCRRRILKGEEEKVLLFFTRRVYPELNPVPEQEIVERIRVALEQDSSPVDDKTVFLISLANETGVLRQTIGKADAKALKKRIKELTSEECVGKATGQLIAGVAATVASSAAVAAAASS